jgi:hypothetical protein
MSKAANVFAVNDLPWLVIFFLFTLKIILCPAFAKMKVVGNFAN